MGDMSAESYSRRGRATQAAILDHAAELFASKGFEGTSLQDVADAMSMSRPAVYHYFRSKDELLAALVSGTAETAATVARDIRTRTDIDAIAKVRQFVLQLAQDRASNPSRFLLLERTNSSLPGEIGAKHRAARRDVLQELTAIIIEGIDAGLIRNADERMLAFAILGMCNWVSWWYRPGTDQAPGQIAEALADSAVAMVESAGRHAKEPGLHGAVARLQEDLDYLARVLPPA
jgi:AcrR family transcriptional regulator